MVRPQHGCTCFSDEIVLSYDDYDRHRRVVMKRCQRLQLAVSSFKRDMNQQYVVCTHRICSIIGSYGAAVTLVTHGKELADLKRIEDQCNTRIASLPGIIQCTCTQMYTVQVCIVYCDLTTRLWL